MTSEPLDPEAKVAAAQLGEYSKAELIAALAASELERRRLTNQRDDLRLEVRENTNVLARAMPTTGQDGTLRQAVMVVCNELTDSRTEVATQSRIADTYLKERNLLAEQIHTVLALHKLVESHGPYCYECGEHGGYPTDWPCDTARALGVIE